MAAAATNTLEDLICERLLPEDYLPNHLRKSTEKTRPMGGGRTPLQVGKWQSFHDEVRAWWIATNARYGLTQVRASQAYPKVFPRHGLITKVDGVRAALQLCVFEPVNMALSQGSNATFILNETKSIACVKSNVNWGGFLIDRNQTDMFVRVALPIEVKPPWQFSLSADDGHVVDLLLSSDGALRDKVRFSLAQIYMYMILEEAEFGVLCSKEQYVFLKRHGKPEDKRLSISRIVDCRDEIGIRKCLLYVCDKARAALVIPRAEVDNGGPTPLASKLVTPPGQSRSKKRKGTEAHKHAKKKSSRQLTDSLHITNVDASTPSKVCSEEFEVVKDLEPPMVSARASQEPTTSWKRGSDSRLDNVSWFQSLAEFDLFSLELGNVLSSAGEVMVREGSVWGVRAAIKMFDFADDNELLQEFRNEVHAYEVMESIQGQAVPRLLAYGSLWGHFMGFLAMTLEGKPLNRGCFQSDPFLFEKAIMSLRQIHEAQVLHNDVAFRNMVLSATTTGEVMFVDFGRCVVGVDEEVCSEELEVLQELLDS